MNIRVERLASHLMCPYCNEEIEEDQPKVYDEYDKCYYHLGCSIELDDDPAIWGYEGDG